jgi:uncharacterized protein (DUF302 family)
LYNTATTAYRKNQTSGSFMNYYISTNFKGTFDEAIVKTTAELKKEGFGVLTEIDIKDTLKKKLDVDFKKYRILGACNPGFAHQALLKEDKIGTMLPCNVIVEEHENGEVEVSAIDPLASMQAVENEGLTEIATRIRELLSKVIKNI